MPSASKIFTGYRALGYVSNHVPLAIRYQEKTKEHYVITSVGKSFHTYNCSKLGITDISDRHEDDITCLVANDRQVFTASKNVIRAFHRGKQVIRTYEGHQSNIHLLLPFADHLISVDEDSHVKIWHIKTAELYLEIGFSNGTFQVTSLVHPVTYLNKILFGSKQGTMQLWNLKSNKLIFSFTGWKSKITVLQQAPAVDVIGIGLEDGRIIVHNIRYDETVVKFSQNWGAVTTISFRSDGHPIMITGSAPGHIVLWDLEQKRIKCQVRDAHRSSVSGMYCLLSEPLMVTSSGDNTLKVWIFDMPDGGPRLLRQREGHSAPPVKIQHYGENGQNILSAGQDSTLRSFSIVHDKYNKSLGSALFHKKRLKQSNLTKEDIKMPPITAFAAEPRRESDWDNILACHRGRRMATTWSYLRSTMGKYKFDHFKRSRDKENHHDTTATAVEVTSCGNFGLIGYSSGHVDMYNLESGLYRGSYGTPTAHNCVIRGVVVDAVNQVTVTGGADGTLRFWKFKAKQMLHELKLDCFISKMILHRESAMLAVSLDDLSVVVIDMETKIVIRVFSGHHHQITDMTFSSDARWLITSSMDSLVRTWDLPSGKLIDCFEVDTPVSSLSMSPTGEFIATSHVDDIGIYLWSNKTLYEHVSLQALPDDFIPMLIENPSTCSKTQAESDDEYSTEELDSLSSPYKSPEQISNELITLSLLPSSRWQNLLNLDIIRLRNKPKMPPKKLKSAPFFLPTIPGLKLKFASQKDAIENNKVASRISFGLKQNLTEFGKTLQNAETDNDFDNVLDNLKEMGPSSIDLELRGLAPSEGGSNQLLLQFVKMISQMLDKKRDFQLTQAYLGLFLQLHFNEISLNTELCEQLQLLYRKNSTIWEELQCQFSQTNCLIDYLRAAKF